jgi:hypothetical protein
MLITDDLCSPAGNAALPDKLVSDPRLGRQSQSGCGKLPREQALRLKKSNPARSAQAENRKQQSISSYLPKFGPNLVSALSRLDLRAYKQHSVAACMTIQRNLHSRFPCDAWHQSPALVNTERDKCLFNASAKRVAQRI